MNNAHITVDVDAAEKYYEVIWNNPEEFKDVVIHLEDFHAFMYFFISCGKFFTDSGFEEIVYQAKMCSVGGVKPVLSRKNLQYVLENSQIVAEAISRILDNGKILEVACKNY